MLRKAGDWKDRKISFLNTLNPFSFLLFHTIFSSYLITATAQYRQVAWLLYSSWFGGQSVHFFFVELIFRSIFLVHTAIPIPNSIFLKFMMIFPFCHIIYFLFFLFCFVCLIYEGSKRCWRHHNRFRDGRHGSCFNPQQIWWVGIVFNAKRGSRG